MDLRVCLERQEDEEVDGKDQSRYRELVREVPDLGPPPRRVRNRDRFRTSEGQRSVLEELSTPLTLGRGRWGEVGYVRHSPKNRAAASGGATGPGRPIGRSP